jgi:hypothetical protein
MKNLFEKLKASMQRYDLYQADDEVGTALNELETAIKTDTETRVYIVDTCLDDYDDLPKFRNDCTDDEFIEFAEREGRIYSLVTFAEKFNGREHIAINFNTDMIRFIQVPVSA